MKHLIWLLFFPGILLAQDFKFGRVSEEELLQKEHQLDKEAHASVLYKNETVRFIYIDAEGDFKQVRHVQERIKIYDKEGYEYANKQIKLYDRNNATREKVKDISGYTYTLKDGDVEKEKLRKESIFEENVNEYWSLMKFTMPNVTEGCVIEFEYDIESPFIAIDDMILQYDIPIDYLDVKVFIPEFFNFKKTLTPKASFHPKLKEYNEFRTETIVRNNREITRGGLVNNSMSSDSWKFAEYKMEINETNVPALKEEPKVSNLDNYRSKIFWEYAFFKGPDGVIKDYSSTWEKLTNTIYKSDRFGDELKKTNYFETDIAPIVTSNYTPVEKTMVLLNYVKGKVKWNGFIGTYTQHGVKKAYKEGEGNTADINLMLTAMLRHAGFNANPVLVSTRDNGIPVVPTISGFNYVLASVQLEDGFILLDASNRYSTLNILPERVLNWQGRLVMQDGDSRWVELPPYQTSKSITLLGINLNEDLSVEGKVKGQLTNYNAFNFRENQLGASPEQLLMNFEKGKGDIEISDLEVAEHEHLLEPVNFSYSFTTPEGVEEIGDKVYFTPMVFLAEKENVFKQENRLYPIDFIYPTSSKVMVTVKIPEGYEIESMPESARVLFNNTDAEFSYLVKQVGNTLQCSLTVDINKSIILPSFYEEFKQFYQHVVDKQTEKVILKRI